MNESIIPFSVFSLKNKEIKDTKIFLDESGPVDISRSDEVKYKIFKSQADRMYNSIWKPENIVMTKDKIDFENLEEHEKFIFTATLGGQHMMDSIASMGLGQAFLPLVSDPMVKRCINFIEFFEELHSYTYEYIIRNVYTDPKPVFEEIKGMEEVLRRGKLIARYYDEFILEQAKYRLNQTTLFNLKKKLWMCLQAVNGLEGIRFFSSFARSFAFAQTGRMVGNGSQIRLIASDELLHNAFTTALIRTLPTDDPEYIEVKKACDEETIDMFNQIRLEEKADLKFVFQHGDMIGLNEQFGCKYVDYITHKRMNAIHLEFPGEEIIRTNPLPWMNKWLNEEDNQPAPQETEKVSYLFNVTADTDEDAFKEIEL